MGTSLIDNFSYKGKRFLDERQSVATLAALRAVPATDIPDGFRAYCAEDRQWYEYNSSNTPDPATGKWRKTKTEVAQETGDSTDIPMSQKAVTDALTKMDAVRLTSINSFNKFDKGNIIDGSLIVNGKVTPGYDSGFLSAILDVTGVQELYSNAFSNGQVHCYDGNMAYIGQPSRTDYMYTLPSGARFIRICGNKAMLSALYLYLKAESKYFPFGVTESEVSALTSEASANSYTDEAMSRADIVRTANQSVNKINAATDFIEGFMLDSDGKAVALASSAISKFIDLGGVERFYSPAGSYGVVMGYDGEFGFVSTLSSSAGGFAGAFLVPEDVRHIRINVSDKNNCKDIFLYLNENDIALKSQIHHATNFIAYGVTYTDVASRPQLDAIPTKLDEFHTLYMNSLNMFTEDMIVEYGKFINDDDVITKTSAQWWYTKYIPVKGGMHISCNASASGSVFVYDKDKQRIGNVAWEPYDGARFQNSIKYGILPTDAAYIRLTSNFTISQLQLFVGNEMTTKVYPLGENFDSHFKYRGRKLVTIGDSITYQRSWQDRLCELTGMWYLPKEVRGDDESVKTEGHGFIKLAADLTDTEDYFETVDGITKTDESVTDGFGYAHPVWQDADGNKYRKPCRMAEGGETVMPVRSTSVYSRASDSKYYKGDVIIVFGGANDKVTYCAKYPTNGLVANATGITNLTTDEGESTFEIYTDDAVLQPTGDYSAEGDTTHVQKYNHSFRACFRGLLKKVVDANPDAEIIVIGPFSTFIKASPYVNHGYEYLTRNLNRVIEQCAREFSCRYIDLSPLFGRYGADRYFGGNDGTVFIHPNTAGGNKIAEFIHSQLC